MRMHALGRIRRVVVHTGSRGSVEIDSSSLTGLISDYNVVVNRFSVNGKFIRNGWTFGSSERRGAWPFDPFRLCWAASFERVE